jgi:HTH-type transcriptional regulator / antitoxin HipB
MFAHSPKELALLITSWRKKLKLSQAEVGKLVGLKQQTISDFEIRPEGTQIDTLFRILSALNLDIQLLAKDEKLVNKTEWKEEW